MKMGMSIVGIPFFFVFFVKRGVTVLSSIMVGERCRCLINTSPTENVRYWVQIAQIGRAILLNVLILHIRSTLLGQRHSRSWQQSQPYKSPYSPASKWIGSRRSLIRSYYSGIRIDVVTPSVVWDSWFSSIGPAVELGVLLPQTRSLISLCVYCTLVIITSVQ